MATLDTLHPAHPPADPARLIAVIGLALALAYATFLFGAFLQGHWIVDNQGRPIASDFLGFWSAGRLVLNGHPAAAYDWDAHRMLAAAAARQRLGSFYPWLYPPPYLFAAALVALLPIVPASLVWLALTAPLYVASIRGILGARAGVLFACGFPGALWNITAGQNGFLTAALIGGALSLMRRHPLLSGACLGLLTFKPQLGLLFPVVLAVASQWRVLASATAVAIAIMAGSALAFGTESWSAFVDATLAAHHLNFALGGAGWSKWQSVFGAVRLFGGSETLAWTMHGLLAAIVALMLCIVWRSDAPFELKAGALSAGALLATPYLFIYDAVVLAVPAAFLLRYALSAGFLASDVIGFAAAGALLLMYVVLPGPLGLLATLIVAALIARRVLLWSRANGAPSASTQNLFATG